MAMDDIYRLVRAVLIEGRMTRPKNGFHELYPRKGPWEEATVHDASIMGDHRSQWFNGYVRYSIGDENRARDATFHELWKQGWTSIEYRQRVEDALSTKKPRSRKKKVR